MIGFYYFTTMMLVSFHFNVTGSGGESLIKRHRACIVHAATAGIHWRASYTALTLTICCMTAGIVVPTILAYWIFCSLVGNKQR